MQSHTILSLFHTLYDTNIIPAREARGFSKNVASKQTSVRACVRAPYSGSVSRFFRAFGFFGALVFSRDSRLFGTNFTLELSIFAFRAYESAAGFKKSADLALMFAGFCLLFRVGANPGPAAGTPNV